MPRYTAEDYRHWIEAIKTEASDSLSSWEMNFVDSIERQLDAGRTLTEAQWSKLESIYAEHTS